MGLFVAVQNIIGHTQLKRGKIYLDSWWSLVRRKGKRDEKEGEGIWVIQLPLSSPFYSLGTPSLLDGARSI